MIWKYGNALSYQVQRQALASFVHRFTMDHKPQWACKAFSAPAIGPAMFYAPQYASDAEWLAKTRFAVRKNGDLDNRAKYCQSETGPFPLGRFLGSSFQRSK